jgi:hypothetical protein
VTIGLGGNQMNREIIFTAQDYLTIKENGKNRKIVDVERLLRSHPSKEVIDFLKTILKEKQIALKDYVLADKTKKEIDETVSVMFRVTMAIKVLEDGKEVKEVDRTE